MYSIVREYDFSFFLKIKKRDFLRFLKRHLKKRKNRNPIFEVSDFVDFPLHGISTTAQKLFIIRPSSCVKDNKYD